MNVRLRTSCAHWHLRLKLNEPCLRPAWIHMSHQKNSATVSAPMDIDEGHKERASGMS